MGTRAIYFFFLIFLKVSASTARFRVVGSFECSAFFNFDSGIFSPFLT